jgi:hypothetical protein
MFLQTEAGLLAKHAIILIEDYPDDDAPDWRIHYAYGSKVRVTTADAQLIKEFCIAS